MFLCLVFVEGKSLNLVLSATIKHSSPNAKKRRKKTPERVLVCFFSQKNDKWIKMMSVDENVVVISDFLEKGDPRVLVIYVNQQSQLTPISSFPSTTKQKVLRAVIHLLKLYL